MSKGMRIILIIVAIAVLATLVLLATSGRPLLWEPRSPAQPDKNAPTHPTEELLKGLVQGPQLRELKASVGGTVLALGASETGTVTPGQLIAQIDSPTARENLRAARARLTQVQAQASSTSTEAARTKLRTAEAAVQAARNSVAQAEKQVAEFSEHNRTAVSAVARAAETEAALKRAVAGSRKAMEAEQAAQAKLKPTGQPDPSIAAAQKDTLRTNDALIQAQKDFTSERQTRERLRKEIAEFVRLQRGVEMRKHSVLVAEKKLQALQQTPAAAAALRRDRALAAAKADVAEAERLVAACGVKSEWPGRLAQLRVRPGMKVAVGQTVALVQETGEPRLVFEAPAALIAGLAMGQRAQVAVAEAKQGRGFAAAITQVVAGGERALVYLQPLGKVSLPPAGTALTATLQ